MGTSDYLVNWEQSKISKEFFIEKFNSLKQLTNWTTDSVFQIREDILGCVSSRRMAHIENQEATHFIWLDTDVVFDEQILFYIENAITGIEDEEI